MRRLLLKLPLCALSMGAMGPVVAQPRAEGLRFAVITTSTVDDTRSAWEPFFADLRSATGLPVQGLYAATYQDAAHALMTNQAQLAWVSNKAALDCLDQANVEVFGQMVDSKGSLGYRALVVTRRDSGITSINQLLSKPRAYGFALGEAISTSGNLMPAYALFVPRGIKPEEQFSPLLRGSHAQTLASVLSGKVHAGAYNTEELERLKARQPGQASQLRVLWESAMIPKDPLLWRTDLPLSVRSRLSEFLFAYGRTPEERVRLKQMFDLAGFKPSTNQQLKFVLEIEDFKQRSEVLLDARLSEAEKNERIGDLRDRYARLARALQRPAATARP
jgi:phosphonate transport system substrate-binding protein